MVTTEYMRKAKILGFRAKQFESVGRPDKAEATNFELQDLDFSTFRDLAGPPAEPLPLLYLYGIQAVHQPIWGTVNLQKHLRITPIRNDRDRPVNYR